MGNFSKNTTSGHSVRKRRIQLPSYVCVPLLDTIYIFLKTLMTYIEQGLPREADHTPITSPKSLDKYDSLRVLPPVPNLVTRITTATTTIISPTGSSGFLRLKVQNGTMGAVTVYDNGAASGTIDYTGTPAAKDIIFGDWTYFVTGCTIVTAAATELLAEWINE